MRYIFVGLAVCWIVLSIANVVAYGWANYPQRLNIRWYWSALCINGFVALWKFGHSRHFNAD